MIFVQCSECQVVRNSKQARVNDRTNHDSVISVQCSESQSGEANDWRNGEHVVLDSFANLKMGKILW